MMRKIQVAAVAMVVLGGCGGEPGRQGGRIETAQQQVVAQAPQPVAAPEEKKAATPAREPGLGLAHEDGRKTDHLERARELVEANDLKGALSETRRALFDDPSSATAMEAVARTARRNGDTVLAKEAYEALAKLSPGDALPMVKLARIEVTEGDSQAAIADATEAILRDPGVAEAYHLRGRAWLQLGMLADAIHDFQQASSLDPQHGWALNNLGYTYLLAGEPQKAVEPLEAAVKLVPKAAFVENNLGIAYEKSGKAEEARAAYAKALELSPHYVKALVNQAHVNQVAALGTTMSDAMPSSEPPSDSLEIPDMPATPAVPSVDVNTEVPQHFEFEIVDPDEVQDYGDVNSVGEGSEIDGKPAEFDVAGVDEKPVVENEEGGFGGVEDAGVADAGQ